MKITRSRLTKMLKKKINISINSGQFHITVFVDDAELILASYTCSETVEVIKS